MADEPIVEQVVKGGECWLEISIDRNSKGMVLWVRADPRVEEFMKGLAEGDDKLDTFEYYGTRTWFSVGPDPIKITRMTKQIESPYYTIESIGGVLNPQKGMVNLSFLRFVGVGSNDGVRFGVSGPVGVTFIRLVKDGILTAARQLFRDYVVPVHINLRITSTELF